MLMGIDIGGTKCAVSVGDDTAIIEKRQVKTADLLNTLDFIETTAKEFAEKYEIEAVGISSGGPLDSANGVILSPPNLPGWDNVRITDKIQRAIGKPAFLLNDANACALAEWLYGAGKGTENMVFLTFGTGMGAGLIINGRLYEGTNGNAGEIGHIRLSDDGPVGFGKAGSFEGFCSGGGIKRLGQKIISDIYRDGGDVAFCPHSEIENLTAKSIGNAAEKGDPVALSIYKTSAEKLGIALSYIIDILNPEVIVIGSIYTRQPELFDKTILEIIEKESLSESRRVCRIVPAALTENVGDYAALAVAKNGLEEMKNV